MSSACDGCKYEALRMDESPCCVCSRINDKRDDWYDKKDVREIKGVV